MSISKFLDPKNDKNAGQTDEKDLDAIILDELIIKKAYEKLNRYMWTPEELKLYDSVNRRESANKACNGIGENK